MSYGVDNSKQFIIVSDEEHMKYAEFLKGYLTPKVLDFRCVLYRFKDYEDNRPRITSTNRLLFLGENADIKKEFINSKFENYGAYIGWHGSNALLTTDGNPISKAAYIEMIDDAEERGLSINSLSEDDIKELDNLHKNGIWAYLGNGPIVKYIQDFTENHIGIKTKTVNSIYLVSLILSPFTTTFIPIMGTVSAYDIINRARKLRKILFAFEEHRYKYVIKKFVDDYLQVFLKE